MTSVLKIDYAMFLESQNKTKKLKLRQKKLPNLRC